MKMKLLYSCVMDKSPIFAYQTLVWIRTLTKLAGASPDQLVVHFVDGCDADTLESLRGLGVDLVKISPFDLRSPHLNKVRQMQTRKLAEADYCILLDCDIAFAGPIEHLATGDQVQAKIVDCNPPRDLWPDIFSQAGFPPPLMCELSSANHEPTPPNYCNGGFYVIPQASFARLSGLWPKWSRWVLDHTDLLGDKAFYSDQIAFCLAMEELGQKISLLPTKYNCPTHLGAGAIDLCESPVALHYHWQLNENGFLQYTGNRYADTAIKRVNDLIATERQQSFDSARPRFETRRISRSDLA